MRREVVGDGKSCFMLTTASKLSLLEEKTVLGQKIGQYDLSPQGYKHLSSWAALGRV